MLGPKIGLGSDENMKLKQIVADLSLDKQMLQDVLKKKFWLRSFLQGRTPQEVENEYILEMKKADFSNNAWSQEWDGLKLTFCSIINRPVFGEGYKGGTPLWVYIYYRWIGQLFRDCS